MLTDGEPTQKKKKKKKNGQDDEWGDESTVQDDEAPEDGILELRDPYRSEDAAGFSEEFTNYTKRLGDGEEGFRIAAESHQIPIGREAGQFYPKFIDRMSSALPFGPTKKSRLQAVLRDAIRLGKQERLVVIGSCRGAECCTDESKEALGRYFRAMTGEVGADPKDSKCIILLVERVVHEMELA